MAPLDGVEGVTEFSGKAGDGCAARADGDVTAGSGDLVAAPESETSVPAGADKTDIDGGTPGADGSGPADGAGPSLGSCSGSGGRNST